MLHREGLDAVLAEHLRHRRAARPLRMERSGGARPRRASSPSTIAVVGKYVNLRDAYLSRDGGAAPRRLRAGGDVHIRWVASDDLGGPATEAALADAGRDLDPGRLRRPRRGGQGRGGPVRARTRGAVPGDLPRPAMRGDRVRSERLRAGGRELLRVRPGDAAPGDRPAPRTEERDRHGSVDATGRAACYLVPGTKAAAAYGSRRRGGAPPPPLRGEPRLPRVLRDAGLVIERDLAEGAPHRDHRAAGPPVLRGRAVPSRAAFAPDPARIRCSASSSRPHGRRGPAGSPPANGSSSPAEAGCRSRWALAERGRVDGSRSGWRIGRGSSALRDRPQAHASGMLPRTPDGDVAAGAAVPPARPGGSHGDPGRVCSTSKARTR